MKKKLLAALLAVLALAIAAVTVFAADTPAYTVDENGNITLDVELYLYGDGQLDGDVDMDDVVAYMRHVLQADVITDPNALSTGEVTADSKLDMDDVVKVMQYVLKAIDTLE